MMNFLTDYRPAFPLSSRGCALILGILMLLSGCTSTRTLIKQAIGGVQPPAVIRDQTVEDGYRLGCPDVVEIAIANWPEASGRFVIGAEGRIAYPALGNPRVEGETTASLAKRVSKELDVPVEQIQCHIIDHRSRAVYVHGPIEGGDRAVLYRGPENIVSFIRRCGGLLPGADILDVTVVRANVARGEKPRVYVVDLQAILLAGDPTSNVLLEPFDDIYIGELPRSKFGRALPHWMRPMYRGFCGVFPAFCPHDWRQQIRDPEP